MAIVDGCPAFMDGCPFSKIDAEMLPAIMESLPGNVREKCPAFKDGCPFKETDSVENLYNKLADMPESHQMKQDTPSAKAVVETLRLVHLKSIELKGKFNTTCPVFATSCPFKTVTTYGSPLVEELDSVAGAWGLDQIEERPRTQSGDALADPEAEAAEPLSKSLKAGTKIVHRSAENVHFVRDFLTGKVPKESYIELLRALYHVYSAMEAGLRELPKKLRHCDFSVLERADTLAADLRYWLGTPEGEPVDFGTPSPSTKQYVDQLQLLSKEDPLMLLAHAYTRYMGDLSGGQILQRAAQKAWGIKPEEGGTSFYSFDRVGNSPADLKAFKKTYRASLDALHLSARRADALVQEANQAFLMNILLFEERDVAAGYLEKVRTIEEIQRIIETKVSPLEFQRAYGAKVVKESQCPFIPGPAGRRKPGEASFHGGEGEACPFPFIWLHDPKAALVSHPVKSTIGLITLLGLLRAAWEYPRRGVGVFVAALVVLPRLKPKKKDTKD